MAEFQGFPNDAFQFFTEIVHNNNKDWFEAQKPNFKQHVQIPAQHFVEALGDRLRDLAPEIQYSTKLNGSGSIMRIYRDVRFSKDKTPYKTNLGISWWEGPGKKMEEPGYFFHLDRDGAWFAGGMYIFPKEKMESYRLSVDDKRQGDTLEKAMAHAEESGLTISGIGEFKRVPGNFGKQHPRAELLKKKGIVAISNTIPADAAMSKNVVDICFEHARSILPLHQWLVQMQLRSNLA